NCSGIKLEGITFGHTDEGYCDRGVLGFYNCSHCEIDRCDLFGCGTEGVCVYSCEYMTFSATKIRDCSYHIMHVSHSSHVRFEGCQFFRNREFEQVNVFSCYDVVFDNCVFANNTGMLFNLDGNTILLRDSVILHDDMFLGDIESVEFINCINEEYFHPEQTFG
ncbi:MAG: right-handed parallel beta-helix repeat-containing protein, partial [Bacteroides sp.]|nr:right-handed parallel beta-helix repeat-containing protein [Bacteroides sp.]